jgi:hypothetical protein
MDPRPPLRASRISQLSASFTIERLLAVILFVLLAVGGATTSFETDTWWQLRAGQLTWQSGGVWTTDPLSWTARGAFWPNHEWLAQLIYYGLYQLGGPAALVGLTTLIALATWAVVAHLCAGPARYRVPLLALGVMCYVLILSARPHMLTLLGLSLLLLMLRHRRAQPFIPALFLLWANLHGGVAFGGAALLIGAGAAVRSERRSWPRWLAIVVASALATLATPLGPRLWFFTISMIAHPQTAYIVEWQPPRLGWPVSYPFFAMAALWVALLAVGRRQLWRRLSGPEGAWHLTLLIFGAALLVMGARAIRNTALFAVVALPLASALAADLLPPPPPRPRDPRRGMAHLAAAGVVAALACAWVSFSWASSPARFSPLAPAATAALRACEGPLYNTYTLGGEVLWFVPERPVFVDSRNDPYPTSLLFDAVRAEQSGRYQELFRRFEVRCAIARPHAPLVDALAADPAWEQRYGDDLVVVFALSGEGS